MSASLPVLPAAPLPAITIYHNPECGTSRNVLALIRTAGIEPEIIEYLETPPTREKLLALIAQMAVPVREMMRQKEGVYAALALDNPALGDDALVDAMLDHPILINRPIVVSSVAARLCRPAERVLDMLPQPRQAAFGNDIGEVFSVPVNQKKH